MFNGISKHIVSMWFPRLASDRVLRLRPVDGAFALTVKANNTERIYCLNTAAEHAGLHRGMSFADARAFCPDLVSQPARPDLDARFLTVLRRWATRYCPWVGYEGADGLVLDVTGAAHLWGGEAGMLADMRRRALRAGVELRLGVGETRGAAWARAHFGAAQSALTDLPVAALRLDAPMVTALQRLGLRRIGDLTTAPRAPLARRFGPELIRRLDQALGHISEPITPQSDPPQYATRMSLPDPIGLTEDVMGITARLLGPLCDKLKAQEMGARRLCLTLRRVDRGCQQVELRLAAPMRDPARILPLFERGVGEVDAGFGIDQIRLEATLVEPLAVQQIAVQQIGGPQFGAPQTSPDQLNDLMTRIGTRIGLENVQRFLPADSHIPERAFSIAPAAYSQPESGWSAPRPRPLCLFPPELITTSQITPSQSAGPQSAGPHSHPPAQFRWRRMRLTVGRAIGPERIAPEWWLVDDRWRSGLRDYWKVDTREGRRLWLFHTPQNPSWFVQGEFT